MNSDLFDPEKLPFDPDRLPRHIAVIMDGNGRWARQRLLQRIKGHEEGRKSVREIVRCCRRLGIPYLTLYAFSKENWQRPMTEVEGLWRLLKRFLKSELPDLIKNEIRLRHIGDYEGIPGDVVERLNHAIFETSRFDKLTVILALNYGGRQEIVRAASLFVSDVIGGKYRSDELSSELFARYLFTSEAPEPDLLIRTGGEHRVSNFLLWQIAYSEIYVTDTLWPDFREAEFIEALRDYSRRERRFGKTSAQVQQAARA